jgi:DNA-binding transcriptional regulator of glucitol operon
VALRVLAKWTGIVALCAVSLVVCCLLAAWQWRRFQSASGTLQNFGYVLQWPLFGIFPAFMFWRIGRLARKAATGQEKVGGAAEARAVPAETGDDARRSRLATPRAGQGGRSHLAYVAPGSSEQPVTSGGDEVLAEYNRYLARLHAGEDEHVS